MSAPRLRRLLDAALADLASVLAAVREDEVDGLVDAVLAAQSVFCAGRGRSELQVRGFAMRLMHLGLRSFVVGETTTPAIGPGDVLVVASGTAATRTLLPIAERARQAGARVALLTATPAGPLARAADILVSIEAPASRLDPFTPGASVLPMGSRFELSLAILLDVVAVQILARREVTVAAMFARHANLE